MTETTSHPREGVSREWNYRPEGSVETNPLFAWPPRPIATLIWLKKSWLELSASLLWLVLAGAVYAWLQPTYETMRELTPAWMLQIWARNVGLICLLAGGLHLWLYRYRRQGKLLKFDHRDQAENNGNFSFRNQLFDNMFWTLASSVSFWTLWEIAYFWSAANGWVPTLSIAGNPTWFVAMFLIIPIWSSFHFYWVHRLLHWPPLYRAAHALHHRNINVGPWSGISMHPIESFLFYTTFLFHWVVASHPVHFLFHAYYQSLGPVLSHSGFEGLVVRDKKQLEMGTFYHQLHHRYFECNYGTMEMPWDRWFGSFHDGSEEGTKAARTRMREKLVTRVGN
ncbi:MAG: sterol desaturase family protein [Pseudomonadota bacterium]